MSQDTKGLDDSDSDSLPDLSQILKAPVNKDISKGDIVFAKFKGLYWPALVRAVYKKERKISVWYTDDPGKTFKLPAKNVCPLHDKERRIKIENDVRAAGVLKEHEGLTSHAIMYLNRKAEGFNDDPLKYFDQTYPYFLVEELLKKDPNAKVSGIKIKPLYLSHEKKNASVRKSLNVQKKTSSVVESDFKSISSDSESNEEVSDGDSSKTPEDISSASSEDENIDKIIEIVKSGNTDDHLKKILLKRIPSEHRDMYEREMKLHKKSTTTLTYTGPIDNDEKIRELIFYLLPLYDSMKSVRKSKRNSPKKTTKVLEYPSCQSRSEGAQYVASVWLPEAIIYAMSLVYNVSLKEAKQLFHKSHSEKKDINILSSLDSEATASNSEIIIQKSTTLERDDNNTEVCSPMKKLCVDRFPKEEA